MPAATPIVAVDLDAIEEDALLLAARLMEELCGDVVPVVAAKDFTVAIVRAFAHGQAVAINRAADRRTCRACGCWDLHACDQGCAWAGADICTACHPDAPSLKDH